MSNLVKQVWEHKNKVTPSFTLKHNVQKLVYFEEFQDVKLSLIEKNY
ncbi:MULTISPECIES: GIY-YIG nuclease family protein [unclassified Wolbachia]|nr:MULTISPECIES: excinuclease ABC subunit C [unclassified Wolbachia]